MVIHGEFKVNILKYLSITILFFVLILFSCNNDKQRIKVGQHAPDFSLYTPEREKISTKKYYGKYLLIHFWADWCSQCRAEFPKLEESYRNLRDRNFEIVAVNVGQSAGHVREFIKRYHISFPMVMDGDLRMSKIYGVTGLPTNYFINDKGIIFKIIIGWVNEQQILKILEEMKNEKV